MIFARLHKTGIIIKEKEGNQVTDSGTHASATPRTESTLVGERSSTVSFSGGFKDIIVFPEFFRVDRGRWFKGWSNGARSPSAMAARRSYPGLRRPFPTGRVLEKGGLSISETTWSFLG